MENENRIIPIISEKYKHNRLGLLIGYSNCSAGYQTPVQDNEINEKVHHDIGLSRRLLSVTYRVHRHEQTASAAPRLQHKYDSSILNPHVPTRLFVLSARFRC
jgi:hypothetical protein